MDHETRHLDALDSERCPKCGGAQVWGYTAGLSYIAGDEVVLHGMGSGLASRPLVSPGV